MFKHAVSIKWSDEDKGYIAVIPGVEGLSAFGKTQNRALAELKIASSAFFESLKKAGRPVPDEQKARNFSGQLRLRLPKHLHADLSQAAEEDGISLNTYIVSLLAKRSGEKEIKKKIYDLQELLSKAVANSISESSNTNDLDFPLSAGSAADAMTHIGTRAN
ncbi:MAG TPA: toxin-antitoxin system HicB family antitoxin [Acidobacteriota bacterium]